MTILTKSLAFAALLGACDRGSGPQMMQPVAIRMRASNAAPANPSAAAPSITSLRISTGQVALGSGDQFGCVDCQDTGSETPATPAVVNVPVDGRAVDLTTEGVGPGSYDMVEIEVVHPAAPPVGWASGATIEVAGSVNGAPFTTTFSVEGSFRDQVSPPVVVSNASNAPAKIAVVISLPVGKWFTAADGSALDPSIPAQRVQIEANVRASFAAPEANEPAESIREN